MLVNTGETHTFKNESDQEIEFDVEFRPGVPGLERALCVTFGLANDVLMDDTGMFRNPVHLALFSSKHMADIQLEGWMGTILGPVIEALAAVGRWWGAEERLVKKYCEGLDG